MAAGAFICKVAQWCGASDLWAVLWVAIIGVLWEIYEYVVEGTEEVYGTEMDEQYNIRFSCRDRTGNMDGDINDNENK